MIMTVSCLSYAPAFNLSVTPLAYLIHGYPAQPFSRWLLVPNSAPDTVQYLMCCDSLKLNNYDEIVVGLPFDLSGFRK